MHTMSKSWRKLQSFRSIVQTALRQQSREVCPRTTWRNSRNIHISKTIWTVAVIISVFNNWMHEIQSKEINLFISGLQIPRSPLDGSKDIKCTLSLFSPLLLILVLSSFFKIISINAISNVSALHGEIRVLVQMEPSILVQVQHFPKYPRLRNKPKLFCLISPSHPLTENFSSPWVTASACRKVVDFWWLHRDIQPALSQQYQSDLQCLLLSFFFMSVQPNLEFPAGLHPSTK